MPLNYHHQAEIIIISIRHDCCIRVIEYETYGAGKQPEEFENEHRSDNHSIVSQVSLRGYRGVELQELHVIAKISAYFDSYRPTVKHRECEISAKVRFDFEACEHST